MKKIFSFDKNNYVDFLYAKNKEKMEIKVSVSLICILKSKEDIRAFEKTLLSIAQQSYSDYEVLCVCLNENIKIENKIEKLKIMYLNCTEKEPIYRAIKLCNGEFVMFMSAGDVLYAESLSIFCENKNDFVYSDEDEFDKSGERTKPHFKPDVSYETLLSYNYIGNAVLYRKNLDLYPESLYGEKWYDFIIKAVKKAKNVEHISEVLYTNAYGKPEIDEKNGIEAVENNIQDGYVLSGIYKNSFRVRYGIKSSDNVGIIINSYNDYDKLKNCLESIEEMTGYRNYKFIIADGGSDNEKLLKYYDELNKYSLAKIVYLENNYNKYRMFNVGAKNSESQYFLFFDIDNKFISYDAIENMLEQASREKIGAVSGKIVDCQNKIVSCGYIKGLTGWYESLFKGVEDSNEANEFINVIKNITIADEMCLMIKSEKFMEVSGFDDSFTKIGGDVELSFKLLNKGYRNVFTPYAKIMTNKPIQFISEELNYEKNKSDKERLYDIMRNELFKCDIYYSKNFDYSSVIPRIGGDSIPINLNDIYIKGGKYE